ncbi:MAG: NADH:ubiquinone reductase (Na(+)-transporting) subunit D [Candidatus Wallbacteria bacterium HGW-Wallbacteria-1]|jgi:Na+-transporting NADH:ubiquinone oxidoreductase subunit D|uniref:NADH:ubiquinone reductase (Na(+)-transporting) subunit D n=1 Tax=Candidatus Wallbacteria bacterium HGW-Wallbacteria-1 TaxID=2013854 RepID=A0A2N1PME7_9BACT|nr:MAG: NADH:ubiquinone reductase (Na(+)-transporting) subunit D [Candidatus Wallbacteria bacterium HGW-Wallbacteria-1]
MAGQKTKPIFLNGFINENPVFRAVLGICSSLAVTGSMKNTTVMFIAVLFVTMCASAIISAMRSGIPRKIRMAVYVIVIATFVMIVDNLLRAFLPEVSKTMGPYVGLIITNCIIMGRAEAYASNNPVINSIVDAAGTATGYGVVLMFIALIRETLGFGTLFGWRLLPLSFPKLTIMTMAPGAFLVLGLTVWAARAAMETHEKKKNSLLHCAVKPDFQDNGEMSGES